MYTYHGTLHSCRLINFRNKGGKTDSRILNHYFEHKLIPSHFFANHLKSPQIIYRHIKNRMGNIKAESTSNYLIMCQKTRSLLEISLVTRIKGSSAWLTSLAMCPLLLISMSTSGRTSYYNVS